MNLCNLLQRELQFLGTSRKTMFPRPQMCLETIAGQNWLIDLVCAVFTQCITVLRRILKNQCFPDPKCVWKQSPKKLDYQMHLCSFFTMNYSSQEHIEQKQWSPELKCVWKQ